MGWPPAVSEAAGGRALSRGDPVFSNQAAVSIPRTVRVASTTAGAQGRRLTERSPLRANSGSNSSAAPMTNGPSYLALDDRDRGAWRLTDRLAWSAFRSKITCLPWAEVILV
jgi:hypothetical protein